MDRHNLQRLRGDVARASAALAVDRRDSYRHNLSYAMRMAIAGGLGPGEVIALSVLPWEEAMTLLRPWTADPATP